MRRSLTAIISHFSTAGGAAPAAARSSVRGARCSGAGRSGTSPDDSLRSSAGGAASSHAPPPGHRPSTAAAAPYGGPHTGAPAALRSPGVPEHAAPSAAGSGPPGGRSSAAASRASPSGSQSVRQSGSQSGSRASPSGSGAHSCPLPPGRPGAQAGDAAWTWLAGEGSHAPLRSSISAACDRDRAGPVPATLPPSQDPGPGTSWQPHGQPATPPSPSAHKSDSLAAGPRLTVAAPSAAGRRLSGLWQGTASVAAPAASHSRHSTALGGAISVTSLAVVVPAAGTEGAFVAAGGPVALSPANSHCTSGAVPAPSFARTASALGRSHHTSLSLRRTAAGAMVARASGALPHRPEPCVSPRGAFARPRSRSAAAATGPAPPPCPASSGGGAALGGAGAGGPGCAAPERSGVSLGAGSAAWHLRWAPLAEALLSPAPSGPHAPPPANRADKARASADAGAPAAGRRSLMARLTREEEGEAGAWAGGWRGALHRLGLGGEAPRG
jgi:hypothetical protein